MARSKYPKQRIWTPAEIRRLALLAKQDVPAAEVARTLHRSFYSTKKKASRLGLALGADGRWSRREVNDLKALAKDKRPVAYMALVLHRTLTEILETAYRHRIQLDFRKRR